MGEAISHFLQTQHFQPAVDPTLHFIQGELAGTQTKGHIFKDIKMGKKGLALKNRVHLAFGGRQCCDILST